MNVTKRISSIFWLFLAFVIAGCGGNDSDGLPSQFGESKAQVSLTVTPTEANLVAGKKLQLKVDYTDEDGETSTVTEVAQYFSKDQSVVKVDKTGLLLGLTEGSTTVTVLHQGVQKEVRVQVLPSELVGLEVIPGVSSSAQGIDVEFTANAIYSDGSKQDVTLNASWVSKNTSVATVESAGVIHTLSAGSTEISAEYQTQTASAGLTVTSATIDSIVVSPKNFNLPNGLTQQLTATAQLSDGTTQDVSAQVDWESDATSVATVDENGLVTGAANAGSATITATIDTHSDTATVTATAANVTQLTISPANPSLPKGTSKQFKAEAVFSDNTTKDVTNDVVWSSSSAAVSISDSGLARAESEGSATVTATLGDENTTTMVTVTDAVINSVTVTTEPNPVELAKGEKAKITVWANYSDGSQVDVTDQATLTSQNPSVAAIVEDSFIEAVNVGATTVTARFNSLDSAPINVTVTNETLKSISIEPSTLSLVVSTQAQLKATAIYSDDSTRDVTAVATWSTADSAFVSVSNTGLVTANQETTSDIDVTVTYLGVSTALGVQVIKDTVGSLVITPPTLDLAKGDTGNLTATANFDITGDRDVTSLTTWTTDDPNIATVTSNGTVQSIGEGNVTITGTYVYSGNTVFDTAEVTVGPKRADRLHLTAVDNSLNLLGLIQLRVGGGGTLFSIKSTVTYSDNSQRVLEPNEPQYMSDNAALVAVDVNGKATLVSADVIGSANVTATFESLVSDNQINVACLAKVSLLGLLGLGLACDIDDTQPNTNYVAP